MHPLLNELIEELEKIDSVSCGELRTNYNLVIRLPDNRILRRRVTNIVESYNRRFGGRSYIYVDFVPLEMRASRQAVRAMPLEYTDVVEPFVAVFNTESANYPSPAPLPASIDMFGSPCETRNDTGSQEPASPTDTG